MSYWESVKQVIGGAYCAVGGFSVWYATHAAALVDNTPVEGLGRAQETIFRYWHTLTCGKDPDSSLPPEFSPPFSGGQCDNVQYFIRYTVQYSDTLLDYELMPPLGKVISVAGVVGEDGCFSVTATSSGGIVESGNLRCNVGGEIVEINMFKVNGAGFVVPETAQESCGNPPPTGITPSNQPFSETRDIDYTDENGNPRTADGVNFNYELPVINSDGSISVPYEVCWGDICFSGEIEFGDGIGVKSNPPFSGSPASQNPLTLQEIEALLDEKIEPDRTDELLEKIDEIEVFASVPEAYQLRVESSRKQLIIMYAEKLPESTTTKPKYARNRLSQSIPHWNGSKNWGNLPIWTRGNFWAKCVLADNSKIYVLADSREKAESVVNKLLAFVSSGVQNGKVITSGKLGTEKITARKGYPKYARFFPKGQETKQDDVQRFDINL